MFLHDYLLACEISTVRTLTLKDGYFDSLDSILPRVHKGGANKERMGPSRNMLISKHQLRELGLLV